MAASPNFPFKAVRPETIDKFRQFLIGYAQSDDAMITRTTESVIKELLAGNQHDAAQAIQQALAKVEPSAMKHLDLRRVRADKLLATATARVSRDQVILRESTARIFEHILREHRHAARLRRSGLRPVQKLLFWGPPGCGKTLTAHLLGGELGLPVATLKLHSVITSFVGETASNLSQVFARATETPMVLLLDEVDALAKARDDRNDVGELKRVVNSLLQAIDEFVSEKSVIIACSNHQYLLDPAVWRRFERVVQFSMPSQAEVGLFLKRLLSGVRIEGDLQRMPMLFRGLSFADIEKVVTRAVKLMVLDEQPALDRQALVSQVQDFKREMDLARRRRPE